jgi:hypothetical protein
MSAKDEPKNEPLAETGNDKAVTSASTSTGNDKPATGASTGKEAVVTNEAGLRLIRESPATRLKKQREEEAAVIVADAEAKAAATAAEAEAKAAKILADAEAEAAAEAAQRALEAGADVKPGKITKKVEKRLNEPAAKKVARLERGIADSESRDAAIGLELAAMAVEREAGDPEAIIASRALRHERELLREALEDMRAALVPAKHQADLDRAAELRAIRERAIDSTELPLLRQEAAAAEIEVKLQEVARLVQGMRQDDAAVARIVHPYSGVESMFLLGLQPRMLEQGIIARLHSLGVLGADLAPGGNMAHAPSVYDVVRQHADVARGLLARFRDAPAQRAYTTQPIPVWNAQRNAVYTAGPLVEPTGDRAPG